MNFHTYQNQSGKLLEGECSVITVAITSESERQEAQGITWTAAPQSLHSSNSVKQLNTHPFICHVLSCVLTFHKLSN